MAMAAKTVRMGLRFSNARSNQPSAIPNHYASPDPVPAPGTDIHVRPVRHADRELGIVSVVLPASNLEPLTCIAVPIHCGA